MRGGINIIYFFGNLGRLVLQIIIERLAAGFFQPLVQILPNAQLLFTGKNGILLN